jgi:hypothetical protein
MRTLLVSIVVGLVWTGCGDPPPDRDVSLPQRLAAEPAPAPPPVLTITLTRDGRVLAEGESLTLDALGELLEERSGRKEHDYTVGAKVSLLTAACVSTGGLPGTTSSGC